MAFIYSQPSSSSTNWHRDAAKTGKTGKTRIKSNKLKRAKVDDELKELQSRVDNFVCLPAWLRVSLTGFQILPGEIKLFSQLPLSNRTLKGLCSCHVYLHLSETVQA